MAITKLVLLILWYLVHPIFGLENMTLTSSLTANAKNTSSLLSPSGDFAFGFWKLKNTNNLFLVAIWYDKIPDKTVVWYGNGGQPAQEGSKLVLTAAGLVLNDPNGQQIEILVQTENVFHAAMLDTGNFVLVGDNNNSVYIWESFKNPTDTILPTQTMESGASLFSRLTETNFSRGRFELYFSDGDLKLSPLAWPTKFQYKSYFSTDTNKSPNKLVFNETTSDLYITTTNGASFQLNWKTNNFEARGRGNYYRVTLDYTGVLILYAYPKSSDEGWSIVKYLPENICSIADDGGFGSGACGYNSYCTRKNARPDCTCPPGYSFMDKNNLFGGCKPEFPIGCGADDVSEKPEDLYEIQELIGVNWPFGDYERLENFSEARCRASCLQDCNCAIAIYGFFRCWKKKMPFANGKFDDSDTNTKALIKVRKGSLSTNKKGRKYSVFIVSLSSSLVFNVLLLFLISLILLRKFKKKSKTKFQVSTFIETNLHMFSYRELEEATNGFKEDVGRGSSAIVFKGNLKFGANKVVAVKKLDKLTQEADMEFRTEMKAIGKTCHKNLVRLFGFCGEGAHRLLVYEFMSNGTLANFLLGIPKPGWSIRAKIALEIARGLAYLHEDCEAPMIHCDIKPENILLDECFTARISDFGLAKLLATNQSRTLTNIRGTRGYVAPEWFRNVSVTAKVDVYSFGVMLLEILCCRKNVTKIEEEGVLIDRVCDCYRDGRIDDVVEFDEEAVNDKERVHRWISIGIWCIQEDPSRRPSMKMVLQMLEGYSEAPSPPSSFFNSSF